MPSPMPHLLADCQTFLGIDIPFPGFTVIEPLIQPRATGHRYICTLHWYDELNDGEVDPNQENIAVLDVTVSMMAIPTIKTISFISQPVT